MSTAGTGWPTERQARRKPTDHKLTSQVLERIPEASLFTELQDVEARLDALINRKRFDLQDVIGRSMRKNKTLRLFVSSSVYHQPWQETQSDFMDDAGLGSGELGDTTPTWNLRIEGRLTDEEPSSRRMFSSMITSIIVELSQDGQLHNGDPLLESNGALPGQPGGPPEVVEWHELGSQPSDSEEKIEFDGLDIRRRGDRPVRAKIMLQLKEYPDKFKLAPPLSNILGVSEESKPGVVVSLWQYIRFHKLQDVDEKRLIKCDQALRDLFQRDTVTFPQLVELIGPKLMPREPIIINYTIDTDRDLRNRDVVFDVPIQVDDARRQNLLDMLNSWHTDAATLRRLDDSIVEDVQALNLLADQQKFYKELAEDPGKFLEQWVASQARDLKVIYSDRAFDEEAVRHSSFYNDDILRESIHLFLENK